MAPPVHFVGAEVPMRLIGFAFVVATIFGATAHAAVSPRQAASIIKPALLRSSKVTDKAPFRVTLEAARGTTAVRSFTADNTHAYTRAEYGGKYVRRITIHHRHGYAEVARRTKPRARIGAGGIAQGTINLRTARVNVASYRLTK
jgi:hypothetical protein